MCVARLAAMLVPLVLAAACAAPPPATRAVAPLAADGIAAMPVAAAAPTGARDDRAPATRWNVRDVRVTVPDTLTVSEANLFYPMADIVWRGEPPGDRHAQVQAIIAEAFDAATADMTQGLAVTLDVQVLRFHSVTEKTRFTVGGVHAIQMRVTLRDPRSGAVIDGPRHVVANIPAAGGRRALEEDRAGLTQRVVIVRNLIPIIRAELGRAPAGPPPISRLEDDLRLSLTAVSMKNEARPRLD